MYCTAYYNAILIRVPNVILMYAMFLNNCMYSPIPHSNADGIEKSHLSASRRRLTRTFSRTVNVWLLARVSKRGFLPLSLGRRIGPGTPLSL